VPLLIFCFQTEAEFKGKEERSMEITKSTGLTIMQLYYLKLKNKNVFNFKMTSNYYTIIMFFEFK